MRAAEIAIVTVVALIILAPIVRSFVRKDDSGPTRVALPSEITGSLASLLSGAQTRSETGQSTLKGTFIDARGSREVRVLVEDARADRTATLRIALRVGGAGVLLARRQPLDATGRPMIDSVVGSADGGVFPDMNRIIAAQDDVRRLTTHMGQSPYGASWRLDEGDDPVQTDARGRELWARLVAERLEVAIARSAPETLSLAVEHELFVGRVVVWRSEDRIAFTDLAPRVAALLPLLARVAAVVDGPRG